MMPARGVALWAWSFFPGGTKFAGAPAPALSGFNGLIRRVVFFIGYCTIVVGEGETSGVTIVRGVGECTRS